MILIYCNRCGIYGDLTYNTKRNLLGAISVTGKIAYHLFTVNTNCSNLKDSAKLIRKSKWHPQYKNDDCKNYFLLSYFLKSNNNDFMNR